MSLSDWFKYNEGKHPLQEKEVQSDVIDYSPVDAREGIIVEGDGVQPVEEEDELSLVDADFAEMEARVFAAQLQLQPCRSPYCECEPGKCTSPGFYDARDSWAGAR